MAISDIRRGVANTQTIVSDFHKDVTGTHAIVSNIHNNVTNTHTVVTDVRQGIVNTHGIVSEIQHNVVDTHTIVSDIHRNMLAGQESPGSPPHMVSTTPSINDRRLTIPQIQTSPPISTTTESPVLPSYNTSPGEVPPPPPRACFGRDELIEKIIVLARNLTPIALIGPGGIGKTSIALTVLHHDRIKQRFGDNRRFIRCDQFLASRAHFLARLFKVIGAGVENPEDLTPLRPFLSSREMILVLDNTESILDSQGANPQEIYSMVEELSWFNNICLCITSRISTVPPDCKRLDIPTLSMDAACRTFYRIYDSDEWSDLVNSILQQLDFHPLSITLLATVAHHNKWGTDRLTREWESRRTGVLHAQHSGSLAATIELSLASPMFQELGPDAHSILEVVAFFPQGIDENNLVLLFPSVSDGANVFDKLCILSLTYRTNRFVTMLAPLRDHLRPKDPMSSQLFRTTKDCYFHRLSADIYPGRPGWEEAQWITSEDVNIEHLLDVLTSVDANSADVWDACAYFMGHLYWHKKRLVALGPKIEGLPNDHPAKPKCLFRLSWLFDSVGNYVGEKRLLIDTLKLWRAQGDDAQVAQVLISLSNTNRLLGLPTEGIPQVKEALEICERLNDVSGQAHSLNYLARLLHDDNQLDATEAAASRAIDLLPEKGEELLICKCHRLLGDMHHTKGKTKEAIDSFERALEIASSFNWQDQLFWTLCSLAKLLCNQGDFDDAHAHVERARSYVINDPYLSGRAMQLQAEFWCKERRFGEARSEALRAVDVYEKLGAANDLGVCKAILWNIEVAMDKSANSREPDSNGELLEMASISTLANFLFSARDTGQYLTSLSKRILPRPADPASARALHS